MLGKQITDGCHQTALSRISGIDTIKYHTGPDTPYGKLTKTQKIITHKRAKRSILSQQVSKAAGEQIRQYNKDKQKQQK